nr:DNA mismatch repair protein PMS1 [Cryptococcus depauperatus CBS 7841]
MGGIIKALEISSIHKIHSGQIVLDLQSAIKELVENSLDAGATNIDVRIKDNGLESVEVSDNGSGIGDKDWEHFMLVFLALRHHTSKLPSFEDLHKVTTFGFRGEALSALCALCDTVVISTATKETAPMAAVIKLGRDGKVVDKSGRIARPRGTTITLNGLFVPLPVRRKEFERTAKKELTKALNLLTAYALFPASSSLQDGRKGVRLKVEVIGGGRAAKRNTQLSTDGKGSLRASVGAIWGPRALDGVKDIELDLDVEIDRVMAKREGIIETTQHVEVRGLISSAQWGQGRSGTDRQFFYINGRPCNLMKVAKAINEVYRSFNTHQVPLAILNFHIPLQSLDINVSPDKRTIFVHSEDRLIESLKTALEAFFEPARNTFAVEGATQTVKTIRHVQSQLSLAKTASSYNPESEVEETVNEKDNRQNGQDNQSNDYSKWGSQARPYGSTSRSTIPVASDKDAPVEIHMTPVTISSPLNSYRSPRRPLTPPTSQPSQTRKVRQTLDTSSASWSPDKASATQRGKEASTKDPRLSLRKRLEVYASQRPFVPNVSDDDEEHNDSEDVTVLRETKSDNQSGGKREIRSKRGEGEPKSVNQSPLDMERKHAKNREISTENASAARRRRHREEPIFEDESHVDEQSMSPSPGLASNHSLAIESGSQRAPISCHRPPNLQESEPTSEEGTSSTQMDVNVEFITPRLRYAQENQNLAIAESRLSSRIFSDNTYRDEIPSTAGQGEVTMHFNFPRLFTRYHVRVQRRLSSSKRDDVSAVFAENALAKAAGITNKNDDLVEEVLSRVISKADFERMEVLGQFNKGFIIARLKSGEGKKKNDDLFIIDQHASDEKYNFETLQQTTRIKGQTLIRPRPLHLTAGDEIIAMENLDILNANGFNVQIDNDKPAGRGEKISLVAMPVSKETTFDFKDLEQLLHLLSDGSRPAGQMVRCTKARSMFASRACRKSVMIGKALTKGQMAQLLRNMGTIDQPWVTMLIVPRLHLLTNRRIVRMAGLL